MIVRVRALILVLGLLGLEIAHAAPAPPCDNCTLDVPERKTAMPLLVVLHGDHETAAAAVARWRAPALSRGWAILGITCPEKQGCRMGQWYMWNPKASWIENFVAAVESQIQIDPEHIYLVGWSGGSTYIGMRAHEWTRFAAVVFHGGGRKPATRTCPENVGAYFLMASSNYFLKYTKRLSDYWRGCKQDRVWDFQSDVRNHEAEGRLLDEAKANEILDWLAPHARKPKPPRHRKRT